jgi:uncharacterized membrane protein YqgA involved in biofilm formation
MTGTFLNAGAIILGGLIGTFLGARMPEKLQHSLFLALGVFSLAFGLQMFLKTENPIVPLVSLLTGVMVGEWLQIEERVALLGKNLETRLIRFYPENTVNDGRFMKGFISSSMLYCIGPMSILGAIQNGLAGDYSTLAVKSVLDGFGSLAFASSLGIGVIFSSIPTFLYQGIIALFAVQVQKFLTPIMINEFTAVGGIILSAIAISGFLEIKHIRTANFMPALVFAPLFAWLFQLI